MRQCSKDAFHDLKSDFRIVRAAASTIAGMTLLITPRLRLEPLDDHHFDALHRLNRDPVVMRYITGRPA